MRRYLSEHLCVDKELFYIICVYKNNFIIFNKFFNKNNNIFINYIMDEKKMEKNVKKKLLKKDFKKWDKESINFLISVYKDEKFNSFYELNILLLDDYIKWRIINSTDKNMYNLNKLIDLYCLIKKDIYSGKTNDYELFLKDDIFSPNCIAENNSLSNDKFSDEFIEEPICIIHNVYHLIIGFIIMMMYILFQYFYSMIIFKNPQIEHNKILELNVPIPITEDIFNNQFIKNFLELNKQCYAPVSAPVSVPIPAPTPLSLPEDILNNPLIKKILELNKQVPTPLPIPLPIPIPLSLPEDILNNPFIKNILELNIPSPEDILSNPFIKNFFNEKFFI